MKSLSLKLSELGIANYTKALKFTKGVERRDLKVPVWNRGGLGTSKFFVFGLPMFGSKHGGHKCIYRFDRIITK